MADILVTALFTAILIYVILKNRKIIKKLTKCQVFGAGISYLAAITAVFIFIYYGGNWIVEQITNTILQNITFLAIVCIGIYLCISILNNVLRKITNGSFPKN